MRRHGQKRQLESEREDWKSLMAHCAAEAQALRWPHNSHSFGSMQC